MGGREGSEVGSFRGSNAGSRMSAEEAQEENSKLAKANAIASGNAQEDASPHGSVPDYAMPADQKSDASSVVEDMKPPLLSASSKKASAQDAAASKAEPASPASSTTKKWMQVNGEWKHVTVNENGDVVDED